MPSRLAIATAATLLAATSATASEPTPPPAAGAAPGVSLEIMVVQRDKPGRFDLTGPDTVGNPFVAFSSDELARDTVGGLRGSIELMLFGERTRIGAFGFLPFVSKKTKTGMDQGGNDTNATYDDDAHLNPGADVVTSNSDDLHALSVEHRTVVYGTDSVIVRPLANRPDARVNWLLGTRYIQLDERLTTVAFDEANDLAGTDNDIDRVRIKSDNTMYGLQLGLEGAVLVAPGVSVGGNVRGGLMANFIKVERSFSSDDNAASTISDKQRDTAFAQFIELNPRLSIKIADNAELSVGGMLMYVNGISEAGAYYRTVTDRDDRTIRDNGDALIWGGSLGLTIKLN